MRTTPAMATVAAASALALAACGGDEPVDAAGTYTVSLTNRENGCMNANWTENDTATGIGVVISQNGQSITADVQPGSARIALDLVLGSHIFTGSVDGNHLGLLITGTNSFSMGTCDYTINAEIEAHLDGDVLSGDIFYRDQTDNSTDCGTLTGCASRQEMLGNRPPS